MLPAPLSHGIAFGGRHAKHRLEPGCDRLDARGVDEYARDAVQNRLRAAAMRARQNGPATSGGLDVDHAKPFTMDGVAITFKPAWKREHVRSCIEATQFVHRDRPGEFHHAADPKGFCLRPQAAQ